MSDLDIPALLILTFTAMFRVTIRVILPIVSIAGLAYGITWLATRTSTLPTAAAAAAFATFGMVLGLFLGTAKESQLSIVLPALLSIVTLFVAFLTEKSPDPGVRKLYMAALFFLFIGSAFGTFYGQTLKPRAADTASPTITAGPQPS